MPPAQSAIVAQPFAKFVRCQRRQVLANLVEGHLRRVVAAIFAQVAQHAGRGDQHQFAAIANRSKRLVQRIAAKPVLPLLVPIGRFMGAA